MTTKNKTLAESAAEILAASLAAAGIKPNPAPADVSVSNAEVAPPVPTKEAPKPGEGSAVPQQDEHPDPNDKDEDEDEDEIKEEISDEDLPELTEEEIEEYLNSLTEEELEALASLEADDEDDTSVVEETTPKLTPEQIEEARKEEVKKLVTENMGSCKDDIDALFNGESLSEDFKVKATTIFEAAVSARVNSIVSTIVEKNDELVTNRVAQIEEEMTDKIDEYLNYVVESWMEENKLAVEAGLRTEIMESFFNGLKNLFLEHYVDIPDNKIDLVDKLSSKVEETEAQLQEQVEANKALTKALNESKSKEILRKICEGLTQVQIEKINTLAEGVEFTTEGEYSQKISVIRENYFPTGKKSAIAPQALVETKTDEVTPAMDAYVSAISRIVK